MLQIQLIFGIKSRLLDILNMRIISKRSASIVSYSHLVNVPNQVTLRVAPQLSSYDQASGKPVVSTTHADIPYVAKDGKTRILASPGSVSELAGAIQQCISEQKSMEQMGEAGVHRMEERHSITALAPKLEEKYDQLR
jgi:glycosyltransferase involved in cell wall biosynthesis